ncbi:Uncharacterised protein [Mycobacteroides abscessus subsp. abscessus]|nr:Uncharacterised protein [Mycobacteroides abscessus subsp. abscessus]
MDQVTYSMLNVTSNCPGVTPAPLMRKSEPSRSLVSDRLDTVVADQSPAAIRASQASAIPGSSSVASRSTSNALRGFEARALTPARSA